MRVFLAIAVFILTQPAYAGPAIDDRLNDICRKILNTGECAAAIESYQISKNVHSITRSGNRLSIQIAGSKRVTLLDRNVESPDDYLAYRYIQYLPSIGFHLVHVQYYEGTEMLLVSNADGGRYFVPDVPRISPDHKHIVVVSASEAYNINGVFVYYLHEGTLSPHLWYEPEEYALYSFVRWNDTQSIALKKATSADPKKCPRAQSMTVGVVLSEQGGRWKFQTDVGRPQCKNAN